MTEQETEYKFIELDRTFHELSKYARESDDVDLRHAFHVGHQLHWPDLIKEYRVVLLSNAGSGKTWEIRNVAQTLRSEGKAAFFLRLEHVVQDFEDAFEVGSFEQFQEWLVSDEEGWLLLDSVDEARLRSPGDFELAIRKLSKRISTAKDRTHIILTGRIAAWRPKTDFDLCGHHLPFTTASRVVADTEHSDEDEQSGSVTTTEQTVREAPAFKLVTFDDLSPGQIEVFANARKVSDSAAFLHAIERADAWSFTARPQDLEELTEFWNDRQKIGTRLELMRNSIERRLTERDQNRADVHPLSAQDARKGAKLLAAAATLSQEPTIRVPDGADNAKGISVREVLFDWDERKQSTLLSRPVFDEAIYGTVRFHHRTVREYLTAEWLVDLLEKDTSRQKIEALLFRNQYGLDVVVPTFRPVLPWLAILDDRIRTRLQKIAPEVVFEGGDPSQLPLNTRQTILHEVCEQMASGTSSRSVSNYDAVQRFANADLSEDIRELTRKYQGNDELTGFLLRMVWLGELKAALPEAKAVALSPSVSTYTRIAAFRALKAIGSEKDNEDIRQAFVKEGPELKREWLAELANDTTPSNNAITWLLACLAKVEDKERFSVDHLTDAVVKFVQSADIALLPRLISGLNELLDEPPVVERLHCEMSEKFLWLVKGAAEAAERLILERHPAALETPALAILHKVRNARDYDVDELRDAKSEFQTLIPAWPALNRALFWYEVELARVRRDRKRGERVDEFWKVSMFGAFWQFVADDFEYAAEQIGSQAARDNKLVALSLAYRIYVENGRQRAWREKLKKLVASDSEMTARLNKYLNPPAQSTETRRWKQQETRWKRQSEARQRKHETHHRNWKEYLAEHVEKLRCPGLSKPNLISNAQYYAHERMRELDGTQNRWTDGDWRSLIEDQSETVARAFRDGVVAYWRNYKPIIRSEGAPLNQTPFPVIFGLTGLSIEAKETENWLGGLNDEEIELACRYASFELNGFPTWFPSLFEKYPERVGNFLLNEIWYELSIEKPDGETNYVLSDVSWSGEWSWDQIAPDLATRIRKSEPVNLNNLRRLLTIVQGSSATDEEIKSLAARKCRMLRRHDHLAMWYAVWTGVEPAAAISSFAARIASIKKPEDRTAFAMSYVTHLVGGRSGESARVRHAFRAPEHLKALFLLMHEHIKREDDIDRSGKGVYSPELRDRAQEARDQLFSLLNEIPGKEAFLALQEIAAHPDQAARPWFVLHVKARAEQDADIGSWTPAQVRDFNDTLERTPLNHRALAEFAVMRLLDLKYDLENGDGSIAETLKKVKLETEMRKFVGHELREKAHGRYSIPQEEELADAKKPDLRFHGTGFDGPVPVELKLADKWTGPELFERMENQLCGDYLRDRRSARGLFVLVYLGEKTGWVVPGSVNSVDFNGLVAALQDHWEQLSPKFPGVDDITVIGIDLTARSKKPNS
ncbi:MAG: hypothetical protein KDJ90_19560 [Nitratireductor sp.]|nr:hypothetical protein [Nitratireductor sp.]